MIRTRCVNGKELRVGEHGFIAVPGLDPASAANAYSRPKVSIAARAYLGFGLLRQKCPRRYTKLPHACLEHRTSDACSYPL
jgi:hypothetical protein